MDQIELNFKEAVLPHFVVPKIMNCNCLSRLAPRQCDNFHRSTFFGAIIFIPLIEISKRTFSKIIAPF